MHHETAAPRVRIVFLNCMQRITWYRAALLGAVTVVLLNTWFATRALNTFVTAQYWEGHTLNVISHTEALVAQVRTAESAARGYILTGSPIFEQQYAEATSAIEQSQQLIRQYSSDNQSQQFRLQLLRARIAGKLSSLQAGIALRHGHPTGMFDPALLGAVVRDTPDRMDSVQFTIHQIEAEENSLLKQRTSDTVEAHEEVWITFSLAFSLDFLLLIAAFEQLVRAARDRERIASDSAQIVELNRALRRLNTELEERVDQRTRELALSNQELEAFSYSVSHDLRAPLRTIDGFSLALDEDFSDKLNDTGRDYIIRVRHAVQRMGTLIDSLLQLSRVTRSDLQREQVDLSQLATLVFHEVQAGDASRSVAWEAQPGVTASVDPRLTRIALENLIGNAWKFTARNPNAKIEFGSFESEGQPVYFVRDNGAGFDMKYVDRLFTAFQRLHGERDFSGSGIGLATVSRIIRRHQGAIWAEAKPDQGATFFFTLTPGHAGPPAASNEAS